MGIAVVVVAAVVARQADTASYAIARQTVCRSFMGIFRLDIFLETSGVLVSADEKSRDDFCGKRMSDVSCTYLYIYIVLPQFAQATRLI
jgi:hypothetical protein